MDADAANALQIVQAPAKLNLFLEVLARRSDGYHEIETLMAVININDTLLFSPNSKGTIRVACQWRSGLQAGHCASETKGAHATKGSIVANGGLGPLPEGKDNLVYTALAKLRKRSGAGQGVDVRIVKSIPAAAGLGGASSDAAAALAAGNKIWKLGWSKQQLAELAGELGSDVPFFLEKNAAVCRGRGERVSRLAKFPRLDVVVVWPPEGLSTPAVFQRCRPAESPRSLEPLLRSAEQGNKAALARAMCNRLQTPAKEISPWIQKLESEFDKTDCYAHQMSGSGSSYFGICRNARQARRIAGWLRCRGWGNLFSTCTVIR